jgi:SAM-dependent methyltransferase
MYDWLAEVAPRDAVLDLASGAGSFSYPEFACTIVGLDEDPAAFQYAAKLPPGPYFRVFGKSEAMPFRDGSFALVICSHALEHFGGLRATLAEIARVLRPRGRVFISVPNGYGLCDAVYRYVFEGGGHVNRFHSTEVVKLVEEALGLQLVRRQKLYSSFVYLWRLRELLDSPPPGLSKRLIAIGRLPRFALPASQWLLYLGTRLVDRVFGTDAAVYGWAFYFEPSGQAPVEETPYLNVCMYCGTGHPSKDVERTSRLSFRCTVCGRATAYFPPFRGAI